MISKQKRNLINELSFWILKEIEVLNNDNGVKKYYDNTIHIKTLLNIVTFMLFVVLCCYTYTYLLMSL